MLQECEFQDQGTKHQILSRSSSEPSQPTFQSTHTPDHIRTGAGCHTGENTPEHDKTNTGHHTDTNTNCDAQTQTKVTATQVQLKLAGRDMVIKDKTWVENEIKVPTAEGKDTDNKEDTNVEPVEREEDSTDAVRWGLLTVVFTSVLVPKTCIVPIKFFSLFLTMKLFGQRILLKHLRIMVFV